MLVDRESEFLFLCVFVLCDMVICCLCVVCGNLLYMYMLDCCVCRLFMMHIVLLDSSDKVCEGTLIFVT